MKMYGISRMNTDGEPQSVRDQSARGGRMIHHGKIAAGILAPGIAAILIRVLLKPG